MRVLVALGGNALHRREGTADADAQEGATTAAAKALAGVAEDHELVIAHAFDVQLGSLLGLALRNALPDRDLATVLIDTVVEADAPGALDGASVLEPQAIVELHSLRMLIDVGVLAICAGGVTTPVTVDGDGTMHGVEATVDADLTASLLARRLEADLLVMLTAADVVHVGAKAKAARRFVEATGRRAAIGELTKAVEIVQGQAGTQISAPSA
jgi:carbamate kinase